MAFKLFHETHDVGFALIDISIDTRIDNCWVTLAGQEPVLVESFDSFPEALKEARELFSGAFPDHHCAGKCQAGGLFTTGGQGLLGRLQ